MPMPKGGAHYAEQMMWDAGYDAGNPETHIGQLDQRFAPRLPASCRRFGLHAHGNDAGAVAPDVRPSNAIRTRAMPASRAARGTYDPAYLNYTLGKLMIMKLRADWTANRGGRKGWEGVFTTSS